MSSTARRTRWLRRRLLPTGAGVVTLCMAGGLAYAHWTASGSGQADNALAAPALVTLNPGSARYTLYPGASSDLTLTVSNPNSTEAHITALALDTSQGAGGFGVDANHASCPLTSLTYTRQTNGTTGWTVPPKTGGVNGTLAITLANALAMNASAPNTCQGATFTVYLAAS